MSRCPHCENHIRFLSVFHWKLGTPYHCPSCGKDSQLEKGRQVLFAWILGGLALGLCTTVGNYDAGFGYLFILVALFLLAAVVEWKFGLYIPIRPENKQSDHVGSRAGG
jgi:hypothetical protein